MAASGKNVVGAGTLALDKMTIASDVTADGIIVNTNKFTVAADTGNTAVAGTLAVTSNETVGGTLAVTGVTTLAAINSTGTHAITGALTVSTTAAVTGNLTVGASKLVVTAASGNLVSKGTAGFGTNGTEFTVAATGAIANPKFSIGADGALALDTNKFTVSAAGAGLFATTLSAGATGFTVDATGNLTKCLSVAAGTNNTEFTVSAAGALVCATTLSAGGAAFTVDATGNLTKVLSIAAGTSSNKFTVSSAGNTAVAGTCAITGALTQTGAAGFTGDVTLAGATTTCCHLYGNADVVAKTSFATTGLTKAVTFGKAYAAAPAVMITPITDAVGYAVVSTTGGFTVTRPSGGTSSAEFFYYCVGIPA